MRGALFVVCPESPAGGIIPADAGSTNPRLRCCSTDWDHPRGCGEHGKVSTQQFADAGSSPRMRGAPYERLPVEQRHGIIPADAGSTEYELFRCFNTEDHPRGCGEHLLGIPVRVLVEGSSPRMRGAPVTSNDSDSQAGIIPADAGSTQYGDWQRTHFQDHPRGCGEHARSMCYVWRPWGSSPRMRGAQSP